MLLIAAPKCCYEYRYRTILHWCPKREVEEVPRLIQNNDQDMSNGNMNRDNGYLVSCKGCRKSFKTVKGLKIHQSRKGCMRKPNEEHEVITGKTGGAIQWF